MRLIQKSSDLGGLQQGNPGSGEKYSDSVYDVKRKQMPFPDRLYMECERRRRFKDKYKVKKFSLKHLQMLF